ncbi:hypothetical protein ACFSC6_08540 [Rufibacter sediminis]|uniref:Lipoprotein n=1 Tax=Rufibacter sediminis TaxID=2762756 RepID=A0ABR6VZS7_9BACT|nr:hypothetical protein [Rufibacter sediminis]MBC3542061.1 hypothetical protein [Rufibacter sediminis]
MKYIQLVLLIALIVSCSEKEAKQSQKEDSKIQADPIDKSTLESDTIKQNNHQPKDSIPEFAASTIKSISKEFSVDSTEFIEGDFNADNKEDFSARVTNLKNGKRGVIIIHNSATNDYQVFGAGKEVNGMDDLDWIDIFESIPKGETVASTLVDEKSGDIIGPDTKNAVQLKGNGVYMHVDESEGGGIIYWNGQKYVWLHIE